MITTSLTRIEEFSSAHRLHSVSLSDEENVELYGKCNNPNGHGHNYKLEVTVTGPVDEKSGMIINLVDLNRIIQSKVLDIVDHKNLDKDVEYFHTRPSTTENVVMFIWEALVGEFRDPVRLQEIVLHETSKNSVRYKRE